MLNHTIWSVDSNLSGATSPSLSVPDSEGVL